MSNIKLYGWLKNFPMDKLKKLVKDKLGFEESK